MNVPVIYTTLRTFEILLQENKRTISFENLKKHRIMMIDRVKKQIELGNILDFNNKKINVCINDMDIDKENAEYKALLIGYKHIFRTDGINLILNDNFGIGEINEFIMTIENQVLIRIDGYFVESLRFLGINKMLDMFYKIVEMEKETENLYIKLSYEPTNIDIQTQISQHLVARDICLLMFKKNAFGNLLNLTEFDFGKDSKNYANLIFAFIDRTYFEHNDIFDTAADMDETLKNQLLYKLFQTRSVAEIKSYEFINESELEDVFNISKNALSYLEKMGLKNISLDNIDSISFDDILKTQNAGFFLNVNEGFKKSTYKINDDINLFEHLFYLLYLKKVNEIIVFNPTNEMLMLRARLMYLLDCSAYALFRDNNIDKIIEKISIVCEFDNEDIEDYFYLSYYFANEIFESENKNTMIKLIYLNTYYKMTFDENVIEILKKYKDHSKFKEYYTFITEKNYDYNPPKLTNN